MTRTKSQLLLGSSDAEDNHFGTGYLVIGSHATSPPRVREPEPGVRIMDTNPPSMSAFTPLLQNLQPIPPPFTESQGTQPLPPLETCSQELYPRSLSQPPGGRPSVHPTLTTRTPLRPTFHSQTSHSQSSGFGDGHSPDNSGFSFTHSSDSRGRGRSGRVGNLNPGRVSQMIQQIAADVNDCKREFSDVHCALTHVRAEQLSQAQALVNLGNFLQLSVKNQEQKQQEISDKLLQLESKQGTLITAVEKRLSEGQDEMIKKSLLHCLNFLMSISEDLGKLRNEQQYVENEVKVSAMSLKTIRKHRRSIISRRPTRKLLLPEDFSEEL